MRKSQRVTGCCECGGIKWRRAMACRPCVRLDGMRGEARVISALRVCNGRTVAELAIETGLSPRQILRILKLLSRRGRIRKYVDDERRAYGQQGRWGEPAATFQLLSGGVA